MIDTAIAMTMAAKPAHGLCLRSNRNPSTRRPRRRTWSVKKTPSHGPIQYEMISRKLLYLWPASCSPDSARKKPATPNTSATMARRSDSGSLIPSARNDIEPEYTFSALAQTAPSAMASSVTSASAVGRWLVNPAVGLAAYLPTLVIVAAAAPMTSSQTQETKTPRPAHNPVARRLVFGGR